MNSSISSSSGRQDFRRRAFTLVEVIISLGLGMLMMGAVAIIVVTTTLTIRKIGMVDEAATTTGKVQEHINKELSAAVYQTGATPISPIYSDPSGTAPQRYGCITYRTRIGSVATVAAATSQGSTSITLNCPADIIIEPGDYLLMDNPLLGVVTVSGSTTINTPGAKIIAVADTRSVGSAGNVTVSLSGSIANNTIPPLGDVTLPALVTIQREHQYSTVPRTDIPALSELHWCENTWDTSTSLVLARNIDSNARYLFADITSTPSVSTSPAEKAISWQISYLGADTNNYLRDTLSYLRGSNNQAYYQNNYAEGLIMPKSGNPINTSSTHGNGGSICTTTSTTTSVSTSTTTTSIPTTSTSTTKTTTTSTTSTSTTKTTTTSTTKTTTTKTTTTKSTSVSTTSTTSISTTSVSTTATTSKSTTSLSTTSTSASTSLSTSTTSLSTTTSTTSKSTTTASTSSVSTSTTSVSTSLSTSVTTTTSTSIPLDG